MYFLTQEDFDLIIKADSLQQIIQANPTILSTATLVAVQEAQSYLSGKYDVITIFSEIGEERSAQLVMLCTDIAIYHLMARVSPRQISEARVARYEQAVAWLKAVARGTIIADLPKLQSEESSTTTFLYGSNRPFNYE